MAVKVALRGVIEGVRKHDGDKKLTKELEKLVDQAFSEIYISRESDHRLMVRRSPATSDTGTNMTLTPEWWVLFQPIRFDGNGMAAM